MDEAASMQAGRAPRKRGAGRSAKLMMMLLLAACAATPTAAVVRDDLDRVVGRGPLAGRDQEGEWQYLHPDGRPESAGAFRKDVRDGPWQFWYADGRPRQAGAYAEDRQVGVWRFWHPNGKLACSGEYHDGREHGEWRFYHDNGQLQQHGVFADGKRMLLWSVYEPDGTLRAQGPWFADRQCGRWSETHGGVQVTRRYAEPAGLAWHGEAWDDRSSRREGFLRDGVPDGLWLTRHRGGWPRALGTMRGGRPEGEWQLYRDGGEPFARGEVRGGRLFGWRLHDRSEPAAGDGEVLQPWNGTWSEAALAGTPPGMAVQQWLAEAGSPVPAEPMPDPEPAPVAAPAPPPAERPEAPTDPGQFTVREREELATYRRFYRDGFLPRRADVSAQYGGSASEGLGAGDPDGSRALVGAKLPVTKFPTAEGGELDLDSLRGRKVLLVILRGFTTQVCVYCFAQTRELAPVVPRLRELDCELVVLFPGTRSRLDAFRAACNREFGAVPAPYRMVYDPDLSLAKALGIEGNLARPSSLLLDGDGVVRFAYIAESVQNVADRPAAQRLLDAVQRLGNSDAAR